MLDPYSSCPCGSGKKFKWCCQAIHEDIEKALWQQKNGQHEPALKTIDDVVKAHPKNPEALGRKAQLLHANGRKEEAEKVIEEAFHINPEYAFGYLLQGLMRLEEQEEQGDYAVPQGGGTYAFDASDQLAFLSTNRPVRNDANHPVAARYAYSQCMRQQPDNRGTPSFMKRSAGKLPNAGAHEYKLLGTGRRPAAPHDAVAKGNSGRLNEAVKSSKLARSQVDSPRYNAAIIRKRRQCRPSDIPITTCKEADETRRPQLSAGERAAARR